jgi:hypothetical protein
MYETRRVFSSPDDVSETKEFVNLENIDSLYIEALIGANECSK